MPFRMLVRAAPFVLGAVAAAIWLRRRAAKQTRIPPAAAPSPRTGRFDRPPAGRFAREPVDIVTVVDDLLLAGVR